MLVLADLTLTLLCVNEDVCMNGVSYLAKAAFAQHHDEVEV